MNTLKNQTIINPISGEKVTFIHTAAETNGIKSVIEIELQPNAEGPPPHYHNAYTETFRIIEGEVSLQAGKEVKILSQNDTCIIDQSRVHTFKNASTLPARVEVTLTPGHEGFENAIAILFGLSKDGLVSKKGIPSSLTNLAIINKLSDSHFTGFLSFVSSILGLVISDHKLQKRQDQLIKKYCISPEKSRSIKEKAII